MKARGAHGSGMLNFVGRRHQAQSSKATTKDALVVVSQLPPKKVIRVTVKSTLATDTELDQKKHHSRTEEIIKIANEIATEEAKTKVRLKINGMIYFNTESGESVQVLEGKPSRIHDALRHIVRDVRHGSLSFHLEVSKVKRRFEGWGAAWASNTQQWKLVKLMLPSEPEWKRLCANLARDGGLKLFARRDSLTEAVEAKRYVMEHLGADCHRIWTRRDSMCTAILSPDELRYLKDRHDFAKKKLAGFFGNRKRTSVSSIMFSCFDPDVDLEINNPYGVHDPHHKKDAKKKNRPGDGLGSGRSRRGSTSNPSGRPSRVSVSRSSVLDVISTEEGGFIENINDVQEALATQARAAEMPGLEPKYDPKGRSRSKSHGIDARKINRGFGYYKKTIKSPEKIRPNRSRSGSMPDHVSSDSVHAALAAAGVINQKKPERTSSKPSKGKKTEDKNSLQPASSVKIAGADAEKLIQKTLSLPLDVKSGGAPKTPATSPSTPPEKGTNLFVENDGKHESEVSANNFDGKQAKPGLSEIKGNIDIDDDDVPPMGKPPPIPARVILEGGRSPSIQLVQDITVEDFDPPPPPPEPAPRSDVKMSWHLIQAIGPDENAVSGSTSQDDYVTSLQLDPSGNYIAIGDSQGRIGIFDASDSYGNGIEVDDPYQFYEEFVSHHPDFDTLYSRRIPTNIIAVEWLKKESRSLHVLATNEKTIKLWRLKEVMKDGQQPTIIPVLCREFTKGHQRFFIHSLSAVNDGETFLSSDELMLNMWHLQRPESVFPLIDELPEDDMVEVNRIITSAKADPENCHRFLYTTSVNEVNICDLRARCMQNRPAQILHAPLRKAGNMSPEVVRELQCITDADFAANGHSLVTRNFSTVRLWDLRYPSTPSKTMTVHESNPTLFAELCTNGCLVDDFRVAINADATAVVTGSYDDYFVAFDILNDRKKWLQARHAHDFLPAETPRVNEIARKVLHVDWHNERDIITVASSHSVYVYEQKPDAEVQKSERDSKSSRYAYA
eukprot:CAMPEP_0114491146 /NCGR_PEP_ID=MMETSP0109-20121206/2838_1 /TAXON_ID=29199 /ORGANISM="Chlorarachnion reptans, Strain CCCM449" /LENGTH=1009 /DNA_ID=CAMNT_0001667847 /DNA_START=113 /DNA_END=3142 /DNA_ORIENTATION=+